MTSGFVTDLAHELVAADGANTIVPQVATSTVTGAAVDCQDMEGSCWALLHVGSVAGTTPTLDVGISESDTSGGTYGTIAGATMGATITTSSHYRALTFKRSKRFCKAIATIGGTGTNLALAISVAIIGQKKAI